MNHANSGIRILLVVIATIAATLSSANARDAKFFATSATNGGRLVLKHSPVLGLNVVVGVAIDGQEVASFSKGHSFDRFITPGRHTISVYPNGKESSGSRTTLDVRAGETYSYVVKQQVNKMVLEPTAKSR